MPTYRSLTSDMEIGRNATIVDTNVLLGAFWPEDGHHEDCKTLLFEVLDEVVIAVPVLVETWGMLVGRAKRWDRGLELLQWISNHNVALVRVVEDLSPVRKLIESLHIDCVDAYLVYLADDLSKACTLEPPIAVATYDTRDFMICRVNHEFRLRLLDLNSLEFY